jgi:flagellar L-ring protein FlgH
MSCAPIKRYLAFLAVPALLAAQSPGSLFVPQGRLVDFGRDSDARAVGDLVTIIVNDSASALASGASTSSRKTSASSNITSLYGTTTAKLSNLLGTAGDQELAGTGQTTRNMTISTTISARVVQVTPNGSLLVEGTKNIGVNSEKQTITLQGLIRPVDLTTGNTISSNQVANLNIQVNGKGVVGDAIRRPHLLYRILLGLLPF